MKVCSYCGGESPDRAMRCWKCAKTLFVRADLVQPGPPRRDGSAGMGAGQPPALDEIKPLVVIEPASPGMVRLTLGLAVLCGLVLAGVYGWQSMKLSRLESQLAAQRAEEQLLHETEQQQQAQARQAELEKEEGVHRARLQDPGFLSGAVARAQHETEWKLRLAHDPRMAATALETNLMQMERLGQDRALAAQAALETVARMAAPAGSRVEVTPHGTQFQVRVAFRMAALAKGEAGAVTQHTSRESLRREIEELSARVMKDLFDFCGWRGIEKLCVSCNHAAHQTLQPQNETLSERQELFQRAPIVMSRLYRVSLAQEVARAVTDWRQLSAPQIIRMQTVEYDGLKTLEITENLTPTAERSDPTGLLEF